MEITAMPHTDLRQQTCFHFRNGSAPFLQTVTDETFYSLTVKTSFSEIHHRFDLLNTENWLKASVEYGNNTFPHLGSVVSNHGDSRRCKRPCGTGSAGRMITAQSAPGTGRHIPGCASVIS